METWPASLPKPQKKFNAQLRSGLADDQEQINSQRTRTYPERESNFSLTLTQSQFKTLRTFYETTLNGGGMLFEADWLTEAGFAFHRLRFLKPFEANLKGMMWEVKMNLEIIAGVPFDGADVNYWPCPPPSIPDPPTNVQASDGTFTDKVQITWTASSGATSYEVYRADTEGGAKTLKGSPETNSFDDTTAVAPTVYYYWVKAVNTSGASGYSAFNTGWRDEGLIDEYGYIYGGYDDINYLQDCDQYTPDTWISKTDMPAPARRYLVVSTISSSGYVYGGYDGSCLQDCDQYTPDTWTSKSNMPAPGRHILAASTISSSGYVYGGYDDTNYLQDCDEYTPDTWASKTDMPTPARRLSSASTISSSGYVYGGYDGGSCLQDCDQYTPDTWISKSNMPAPGRHILAASTIGSSGYVYGGHDGSCLQDCDQYTPDTWTSKSNMPAPGRYCLAASTIGSKGYVYGGYDDINNLEDCDEYTPDTWTSKTDMPTPARRGLAASTI